MGQNIPIFSVKLCRNSTTCGDFHPAYCELRDAYWQMREIRPEVNETLMFKTELQEMVWVDYPVAHECPLFDLYDRLDELLKFRFSLLDGRHTLMYFLECAL